MLLIERERRLNDCLRNDGLLWHQQQVAGDDRDGDDHLFDIGKLAMTSRIVIESP